MVRTREEDASSSGSSARQFKVNKKEKEEVPVDSNDDDNNAKGTSRESHRRKVGLLQAAADPREERSRRSLPSSVRCYIAALQEYRF